MTDAWMKRGSERQEFADRIWTAILDEEDETHEGIQARHDLCTALLDYFAEKNQLRRVPLVANHMEAFFRNVILPAYIEFARTPEEVDGLLAELLTKQCESITRHFTSALQRQEIQEPSKLFDGHQAMDDV